MVSGVDIGDHGSDWLWYHGMDIRLGCVDCAGRWEVVTERVVQDS